MYVWLIGVANQRAQSVAFVALIECLDKTLTLLQFKTTCDRDA